eukprot:CAMPEP_0204011640 /NCGR_PEP_ID=MMETSP0360-20130528/23425_1 /ASSEMBLY_ACC=CAM_ASM_000342 /TAXON_ID=268821 /ORGANISM="Scrippsiella Hangoei, Strain SHTV-5" /LENGTH=63 /DNA_ID=CAMNT_0050954241 /DNA_START=37 /DNA_END=228 /DNA_ORIENTATION=-
MSSSAVWSSPWASTYSKLVKLSQASPLVKVVSPRPQPKMRPEAPTPETVPPGKSNRYGSCDSL